MNVAQTIPVQEAPELSDALLSGELNLSERQLLEVPTFVTACCGLVQLDLSANCLINLPESLSDLRSLIHLDVSFNQLRALPAHLGQLTALTALRAHYNQIEVVHEEVLTGLSGSLVELHLSDNALTQLPASASHLTALTRLDLRYNRLTAPPLGLQQRAALWEGGAGRFAGTAPDGGRGPGEALPLELELEGNPLRQHTAAGAAAPAAPEAAVRNVSAGRAAGEAAREGGPWSGGTGSEPGQGPGFAHNGVARPSAGGVKARHVEPAVQVLQLGDAGRGIGGAAQGGGVAPERRQGQPLSLALAQPAHPGLADEPPSPLTDLRNCHADLELSYDHDDCGRTARGDRGGHCHGGGPEDGGIDIRSHGRGGGGADGNAVASPHRATQGGIHVFVPDLSELADLPPAAAAVMYRSMDMVAAGLQEMREGRPLSRGGAAPADLGTTAGLALGRPPPGTQAGGRPTTVSRAHRPGTGLLRPGSSAGQRPGTSARPGSSQSRLGAPESVPTGALALVSSGAAAAAVGRSAAVGDVDADGGGSSLGGLGPITFPLASGVRGMLRRGSGGAAADSVGSASHVAVPGGQSAAAASAAAATSAGGALAGRRSWRGAEETAVGTAALPSQEPHQTSVVGDGGVSDDGACAAGDGDAPGQPDAEQMLLVRRLLAERNPGLLAALDEQVWEG